MFIAEVNSSRTNLSPFTKGYRGWASRMQLVSNLLKGFPHGDPPFFSTIFMSAGCLQSSDGGGYMRRAKQSELPISIKWSACLNGYLTSLFIDDTKLRGCIK